MLTPVAAVLSALGLIPLALAQENNTDANTEYTVWSSVILTRTGERTPEILGSLPTTLTAEGANQAYRAGQFFRRRYIESNYRGNRNGSDGGEVAGAPMYGLASDTFSPMQLFAIALEQQYNVGTAQAFMQGLYPPWQPGNNSSTPGGLSETNMRNGTYVVAPLGGYQYPQIHSTGPMDYNYIYLSGNLNCPSFETAAAAYTDNANFGVTREEFDDIYNAIEPAVFEGVLDSRFWDYTNAYAIYDYLRYQYAYNETTREALDRYHDVKTNSSHLNILRWLADEQQFAQLGNVSAINPVSNKAGLPGVRGSISTIAGNMLGARIMDSFADAINNAQQGFYKLNLLFADYHPFTSFFALVGLPEFDSNFYGTPNFASSAVFELFSHTPVNQTEKKFPDDPADLWVRFYFRNGSDSNTTSFRSYGIFDRGADADGMRWSDFSTHMSNLVMSSVGDWCTLCGASPIFCAAWNHEESRDLVQSWARGHGISSDSHHRLSPAVSGVIGATVALVLAGLIFALLMLLAGLRFRRDRTASPSRPSLYPGGFKGGHKLPSDQDLTIPRPPPGPAVVGASTPRAPDHERAGSWELNPVHPAPNPFPPEMRQSMDRSSRRSLTPCAGLRPTEPRHAV